MRKIIVVKNPKEWQMNVPGIQVVSAKDYLGDSYFFQEKNLRVFNLCNEYRYQTSGYYVSLLAEARGHKPIPDVKAILDMRAQALVKVMSDELDDMIQKSFGKLKSKEYVLSVYFGRNMAKQYDRLCREIHKIFQAPLIRAKFALGKKWYIQSIKTIPFSEIPQEHLDFAKSAASEYFAKTRYVSKKPETYNYDLAILVNRKEHEPPSNPKAIDKFVEAAENFGFRVAIIGPDDFNLIPTFDALFIRETTHVNNEAYRFARRAQSDGLAVIDSPDSILRCGNKVFLGELLQSARIPTPKTMIVHKDNRDQVIEKMGLPCVIKLPDSAFSLGVKKATTKEELNSILKDIFLSSDLAIAQEFTYTDYDWRIGVLDGRPLFACRYYMAKDHWQIYNWKSSNTDDQMGEFDCLPITDVPPRVVEVALKSANLIGKGLYGVDIKVVGDVPLVIEVNDNPNIDAGVEDKILGDELYRAVIRAFKERIEEKIGRRYVK